MWISQPFGWRLIWLIGILVGGLDRDYIYIYIYELVCCLDRDYCDWFVTIVDHLNVDCGYKYDY